MLTNYKIPIIDIKVNSKEDFLQLLKNCKDNCPKYLCEKSDLQCTNDCSRKCNICNDLCINSNEIYFNAIEISVREFLSIDINKMIDDKNDVKKIAELIEGFIKTHCYMQIYFQESIYSDIEKYKSGEKLLTFYIVWPKTYKVSCTFKKKNIYDYVTHYRHLIPDVSVDSFAFCNVNLHNFKPVKTTLSKHIKEIINGKGEWYDICRLRGIF